MILSLLSEPIVHAHLTYGCKHSKVDNSWSMPSAKWKWFNLYVNFEFCEEKDHIYFKDMLIYKAKQFFMTRKNSKKNLQILEDAANDVQIGDIEHVIVF